MGVGGAQLALIVAISACTGEQVGAVDGGTDAARDSIGGDCAYTSGDVLRHESPAATNQTLEELAISFEVQESFMEIGGVTLWLARTAATGTSGALTVDLSEGTPLAPGRPIASARMDATNLAAAVSTADPAPVTISFPSVAVLPARGVRVWLHVHEDTAFTFTYRSGTTDTPPNGLQVWEKSGMTWQSESYLPYVAITGKWCR